MEVKKITCALLTVILSTISCISLCVVGFFLYYDHQRVSSWEEFLALPLPQEVISDLCNRNLVQSSIGDCQNRDLIIEQRFTPEIFKTNLGQDATYEDASNLFGAYEFHCEKSTQSSPIPNSCQ